MLSQTFFYTGIPDRADNAFWSHFWTAKLAVMGTRGIRTFSRSLRYRNQTVPLPGGGTTTVLVGEEKGIDVRLALDVVRMARENLYDVALIFSQDQDLSEAADEVKAISVQQGRWIKVACAFPVSPTAENRRAALPRTGDRDSARGVSGRATRNGTAAPRSPSPPGILVQQESFRVRPARAQN